MPAIDINRVRQDANDLLPLFNQPQRFIKPLEGMLRRYSDPALRQSLVVAVNSPQNGFGTPAPVLKSIRNTLRRTALAYPDLALALADALWAAEAWEERWLAAELLGIVSRVRGDAVAARLDDWSRQLRNFEVADALATSAGGPWARTQPISTLPALKTQFTLGSKYAQRYVIMCLVWLARDRTYGDVMAVLSVLPRSLYEIDLEVRKVIALLLRELSPKNNAQVARFLREWANTLDRNAHWVVRHALDKLDEDSRNDLLVLLRGKG